MKFSRGPLNYILASNVKNATITQEYWGVFFTELSSSNFPINPFNNHSIVFKNVLLAPPFYDRLNTELSKKLLF